MLNLRHLVKITHGKTRSYMPIAFENRSYSCLCFSTQSLKDHKFSKTNQTRLFSPVKSQRFASTEVTAAVTAAESTTSALTSFWQTLSNSTPVAYMQQGLVEIHDFTGIPWWGTIVLSTFMFRSLITLPLTIYQHKITARIEKITLEMPAIVAELKKEAAVAMKRYKWTEKQTRLIYNRSLKKQWNILVVRENCHPAKTLIVLWGQIPLWICQSVAIRNLVHMLPNPNSLQAKLIFTELTIGGFGWIPNLTEVDNSYILPVTLGVINLCIIELQSMLRTRPSTRLQNIATNAFRVLSVVMVPVACSVPSALCVYWVASSTYGLAQNVFILSPKVRRAVGIPKTQTEFTNPYEHLWTTIQIRTGQIEAKSVEVKSGTDQIKALDSENIQHKDNTKKLK